MLILLHLADTNTMMFFQKKFSDLKGFVFERYKRTPIHFTISLGLVLNYLVDATCLSATYMHMLRQQI